MNGAAPVQSRAATPATALGLSGLPLSNLVHNTLYRRGRAGLARAIHRIDDVVTAMRRDKFQVLFEAATPMSLAVFKPVLRVLQNDSRLEFWFSIFNSSRDSRQVFESVADPGHIIDARRTTWRKFDAYVNADFWDMTWLRRQTRRMHFFHGVAGKYGLDAPVRIAPVVTAFDRLMFANRDRLQRYAEAGLVDAASPQAALIGYPKVDCLVDGSLDRKQTETALGLTPRVPTVLYAPTWSPYSSLNVMGIEIISALARLDVNVVVKLHDRSHDLTERGSGGVNWRTALTKVCQHPHVRLAEGTDASPYLHAADVLVTDHSSVGFEFTLLDRPIITIDCPQLIEHANVNPQKVALLQSASQRIHRPEYLAGAIVRALRSPGEHHEQRSRIAQELFYRPGTATARAVRVFYDLLGITHVDSSIHQHEVRARSLGRLPSKDC